MDVGTFRNFDPWVMTVHLSQESVIDREEVLRALTILIPPMSTHELRGLPSARSRIVRGRDLHEAVEAVAILGDDHGVYFTLNPVRPDLGNRAAKVTDITARYWFLIDVDRVKTYEPDDMATDEEKAEAFSVAADLNDWLLSQGWPAPVMIDSGNGAHLLFRIDLPNDDLVRVLLHRVLKALALKWNTAEAEIDTKVHNASRISKLPGTWVRKGMDSLLRPWRMAKMLWWPDDPGVVTVEQLERVAGIDEDPTPEIYDPWEMTVTTGQDKKEAYVKSAVERELAGVVMAKEGSRNDRLNTAAFSLGQLVGAHLIDRRDAEKQLHEVGRRAGLSETEVAKTVASGLDSGAKKPRVLPGSVQNGQPQAKPLPTGNLIIWAKDIKPRRVEWLWPNRIPVGKMTTFAGQTGIGKTFTICDIAARVSRGMEVPNGGGECFEEGKVLFISSEDDNDDTLVPRLTELGANLSKIAFLSPESEDCFSLAALELLNRVIDQMGDGVKFVAIDPPTSYLGKVDDHKNAELRGLLSPLKRWASKQKIGLIFVTHVNKSAQSVDALSRVMGSVAWVAAVRAAHMFCRDPEVKDRNLFIPLKVNIGPEPKGLSYRIKGTAGDAATLEWFGEVETTADEAMGADRKKSRGMCAAEWLAARFRESCEWDSEALRKAAMEAGISKNALWSPEVNALPIKKKKRSNADGDVYWVWRSEDGWPDSNGNVGNLGNVDDKPF